MAHLPRARVEEDAQFGNLTSRCRINELWSLGMSSVVTRSLWHSLRMLVLRLGDLLLWSLGTVVS